MDMLRYICEATIDYDITLFTYLQASQSKHYLDVIRCLDGQRNSSRAVDSFNVSRRLDVQRDKQAKVSQH